MNENDSIEENYLKFIRELEPWLGRFMIIWRFSFQIAQNYTKFGSNFIETDQISAKTDLKIPKVSKLLPILLRILFEMVSCLN